MRHHQTIAGEESAGASPAAASIESRSPGGVCCGGSRVTPTMAATSGGAVAEAGKLLPNGDIYIGEFAGNAPHGRGKCIWIDGCVYDGEWRKGKAAGRGNLSWPSGAAYDGEFKKGRMEGYGAFVKANGETYHGSWIENRKDGYGKKWYANGDFYEGGWRWDVQEGHGRYVWRNGIQYVGEWRDGMISGRGVLVLANGDLCDGKWEKGVLKRSGVFGSRNCSCYLGRWIRDLKNQRQIDGVSCSASSDSRKSVDAEFPGICMGDSDGEEAGEEEGGEVDGHKKPWQTISKGHKNYELVLSLQLGIRYSVGKSCSKEPMKLWPSDFDPREKFWTRFPPEGSGITRSHHSSELRWKDYCPKVFRHLRKLFDVDPVDYVEAICGTDSLRELSSPGKSGSLFFLSGDDRFIIKTVKKGEVKILIKMLLNYYQHVCKYENSLLTKFYGVHCVKPIGGHKVRFVVMGNLFCSEYEIHRRFDLKGSSHGRSIHKSEEEVDETSTLKDLDLNFVFHLQKPWFKNVMWQIERDCEFLEAEGIMDYSLLVGFHSSDDLSASKMGRYSTSQQVSSTHGSFQGLGPLTEFSFPESRRWDTTRLMDGQEALIRLGANMPARAKHVFHGSNSEHFSFAGGGLMKSPPSEKIYKCILYFGIIDILRDYNFSKKLEHAYKSLQVNPISISVVDPKLYSRRFRDFMARVFVEDD